MRLNLEQSEFEKIYTPEKVVTLEISKEHQRYTYLDQSKKTIYMKHEKDKGDEYYAYSVKKHGQNISLLPYHPNQNELQFLNEIIAGTTVEDHNRNFASLRTERPTFSTNDILNKLTLEMLSVSRPHENNEYQPTDRSEQNVSAPQKNDYLNRLFRKYWTTDKSSINLDKDGVDDLYAYPDSLIWKLHYECERFGNEDALKFRAFLLVPGIQELVNKGLFNTGDLLTCRHLNESQAAQIVEIYNDNKDVWKSIGMPKLINLVFRDQNGYGVVTKEKAREIVNQMTIEKPFVPSSYQRRTALYQREFHSQVLQAYSPPLFQRDLHRSFAANFVRVDSSTRQDREKEHSAKEEQSIALKM